jgi:HEAT repeat protein
MDSGEMTARQRIGVHKKRKGRDEDTCAKTGGTDAGIRQSPILNKLKGDDRRSIGRSNEVMLEVLRNPQLFGNLFGGMLSDNKVVRMRAADAVEKITRRQPKHLQRYKHKLITRVTQTDQPEVRWHVAQMLPRLKLKLEELPRVVGLLYAYLNDPSRIVATSAMQALADLAKQFPHLRRSVLAKLRYHTATGSPAMKSRGRKLLAELE